MKKKRRIVAQKEEAAEEACGGRLSHESRVEDEGQDVPGPINCTRRSPSSSPFPIPPFLPFPSLFLPSFLHPLSNEIAIVLFRFSGRRRNLRNSRRTFVEREREESGKFHRVIYLQ